MKYEEDHEWWLDTWVSGRRHL